MCECVCVSFSIARVDHDVEVFHTRDFCHACDARMVSVFRARGCVSLYINCVYVCAMWVKVSLSECFSRARFLQDTRASNRVCMDNDAPASNRVCMDNDIHACAYVCTCVIVNGYVSPARVFMPCFNVLVLFEV